MKKFIAPKPIEIEIPDFQGNMFQFRIERVETETLEELYKVEQETPGKNLRLQMVVLCGGKEEDYKKFDTRTLNQVIDYLVQQIRNPT